MDREKAEEFWSKYTLPFEFDVGIKGRLSGLTRGSTGTGRASNTKNHLWVQEKFQAGRLGREAETYLCDPSSSAKFEFTEERYVENGEKYTPPVTCKKCLGLMERWEDA